MQVPPECDPGHVYHLFPVLSPERASVQTQLLARGVETLIHYPVPIPRQPALAALHPRQCVVADRVCSEVCSLPMYPALSDQDVDRVVAAVRSL